MEVSPEENSKVASKQEANEENKDGPGKDVCQVCFEEIKAKKGEIQCGHIYCLECIHTWGKIENTCPTCRQPFNFIKEVSIGRKLKLFQRLRTVNLEDTEKKQELKRLSTNSLLNQSVT